MPAAAVIPAPIAYIKVVAVKKLVVGFLAGTAGPRLTAGVPMSDPTIPRGEAVWHAFAGRSILVVYCEQNRVFKAGLSR